MKRLLLSCLLFSAFPLLAHLGSLRGAPLLAQDRPRTDAMSPVKFELSSPIDRRSVVLDSYYDVWVVMDRGELQFHHQGKLPERLSSAQGQLDTGNAWMRAARFFQVMNELHPEDAQEQMKALGISLSIDGKSVGFSKKAQ